MKNLQKMFLTFVLVLLSFGGVSAMYVPESERTEDYNPNLREMPTIMNMTTTAEPTLYDEPVACTMEYRPMCGIDGKVYSNRCMAEKSAKTKVAYEGECLSYTATAQDKYLVFRLSSRLSHLSDEIKFKLSQAIISRAQSGKLASDRIEYIYLRVSELLIK